MPPPGSVRLEISPGKRHAARVHPETGVVIVTQQFAGYLADAIDRRRAHQRVLGSLVFRRRRAERTDRTGRKQRAIVLPAISSEFISAPILISHAFCGIFSPVALSSATRLKIESILYLLTIRHTLSHRGRRAIRKVPPRPMLYFHAYRTPRRWHPR